jgi:MFS family permease
MLGPMLSFCNGISALGPVIGGVVAQSTGAYTWVFLALLAVAIICLVLVGFTLPETARSIVGNGSKPAHGLWRTCMPNTWLFQPGRTRQGGLENLPGTDQRPKWTLSMAFHSLRIIFYPDAAAILWMIATSYSVYYTFQVAISVIYADIYNYNDLEVGLTFLPGLVGMTIGGIIAGKMVDNNFAKVAKQNNITFDQKKAEDIQAFPIETARYQHVTLFIALEVGLVIGYGWAVYHRVHPAAPLVLQFFICALSTLLSHTASALLVDVFPNKSSTSYASSQVVRCGLSAASAAVLDPLVKAVGRGWYFTIFALFVGVSGFVSVLVSRRKGRIWRQKRMAS